MTTTVRWRQQKQPACCQSETWFARYRGWTLYAGRWKWGGAWHASLHRFMGGGADMPECQQFYQTLEGAQNAAEFYAEHEHWPHEHWSAGAAKEVNRAAHQNY